MMTKSRADGKAHARVVRENRVAHAKRRARERYGVVLNAHGYWSLVEDIRTGRATLIATETKRRRIYRVEYAGVDGSRARLYAVFLGSFDYGLIVTFLPPEAVEKRSPLWWKQRQYTYVR